MGSEDFREYLKTAQGYSESDPGTKTIMRYFIYRSRFVANGVCDRDLLLCNGNIPEVL